MKQALQSPKRKIREALLLTILVALFLLSACTSEPIEIPLIPTASMTVQPPTETIVWFPSTDTPTPTATQEISPTPEQKPGVGEVIFEDDFSDEGAWQISKTTSGNMVYGNNDLTLVVAAEKRGLQSFLTEQLPGNSYLEMTANPSLCRGRDTYGLLLRAEGENSYYRYVLACTGEVRVERYRNGELAVLQDWTSSGQLPPGAPVFARLGVWMKGNELRFFINDVFQFAITDPVFQSGQLGVFARTVDKPPLTVSFSDLIVYELK
ncbi:MAG: hypothetical protein JEZ00_06695 [Anaerolineaceae bacterium]|nr:hypothetical protein [Anaerolineaceae bacterium]